VPATDLKILRSFRRCESSSFETWLVYFNDTSRRVSLSTQNTNTGVNRLTTISPFGSSFFTQQQRTVESCTVRLFRSEKIISEGPRPTHHFELHVAQNPNKGGLAALGLPTAFVASELLRNRQNGAELEPSARCYRIEEQFLD
jgi:hypothetical protein